MSTKVWLEIQRESGNELRPLTPKATHAESTLPCPGCAALPLRVQGTGPIIMPDNRTIRSGGVAMCCGDNVGWMFAQPETLFGLREDVAVLYGRARVYW